MVDLKFVIKKKIKLNIFFLFLVYSVIYIYILLYNNLKVLDSINYQNLTNDIIFKKNMINICEIDN